MGRTLRAMILLLTMPLLLGSCGLLAKHLGKKAKPDKDAGTKDVSIGIIELVNPEQGFVLVRTDMKLNLQPGSKLETRPITGFRSVLTVSPEQKLNFLSADITSGFPQKGEAVVMPHQAGATATTATPPPLPPSAPSVPASNLPPPIH
ncbi:MAG: hypothetical protein K8R87_07115 [Verrucomicrobia bacterium]|nr:hypothetical protein [Verrucomicrobiota bacterium]